MASIYANLLEQKKPFAYEKSATPRGLVWDTNMAAVSLFWDTNMAAVTSCENTLYGIRIHVKFCSFNTFYCVWSIIPLHCTWKIHLSDNYNNNTVTILKYYFLNWKEVSVTNVDIFEKKHFSLQFFFSLLRAYNVAYFLSSPRGDISGSWILQLFAIWFFNWFVSSILTWRSENFSELSGIWILILL